MARRRRRYLTDSEEGGLNLTPLLDVIFNLIFFFVVATTIRTEESFFDLTLPTARQGDTRTERETIPQVTVLAGGELLLDGEPVTAEALPDLLRARVETMTTPRAIISADALATTQHSMAAMDLIREAGITELAWRAAHAED